MTNKPHISIVSPVYNGEGIVQELVNRIVEHTGKITSDFEILLIEDRSPDNSWKEIRLAASLDSRVKGVRLSRNFGQHNAISAAMEMAQGDYLILMDCDLQHDPVYIPELYRIIKQGFDIVYTRTITREHHPLKNVMSKAYYRFLKVISNFDMDPNIGNYTILSRKAIDGYNKYNDYNKAYLWALRWAGYDYAVLDIEHKNRYSGKSSYSFTKLIRHAVNVATTNSNKLLFITFYLGLVTSLLAFLGILFIVYKYFTIGALEGWSSLMVVIMFFSGLILTAIGICSIYISNIFDQTKNRPRYLISETVNVE